MADTQRDLASLLALLPDNTSGDISPQDLRDFVVSALGGYGQIELSGVGVAQTGIGTTPTKITGFNTNSGLLSGATPDHTLDQITALVTGHYWVSCALSFTGSAGAIFDIQVFVNGAGTNIGGRVAMDATGSCVAFAAQGIVTVGGGTAVDLRINANVAAQSITPVWAALSLKRIR